MSQSRVSPKKMSRAQPWYGLKIFRGRCKIVQWLGMPSFVTIGRSVRELFSENPRGGGLHQPPPPVPARVNFPNFLHILRLNFPFPILASKHS